MAVKIYHLAAHLGGGVGKAIVGLIKACNSANEQHKVLLLELPEKMKYVKECESAGIEVIIVSEINWKDMVREADVLVVSWWQHPLMPQFLCELSDIPCRILLWSHVNGCVYPYLPSELAQVADEILFTTWYSMENPYWPDGLREIVKEKACLVSGIGDFNPAAIVPKKDYAIKDTFTIGYMGTLNYAKLHPEFWNYCKAVMQKIENVSFLMVGDYCEELKEEAAKHGLSDKVHFTGYVENVYPYLQEMDVFGYLLSPNNYATTENALLEAMATGLPVIVLNNKPEQYIVTDGKNGFLVESPEQYVEVMNSLFKSETLRKQIGEAARENTIYRYSLKANMENFRH